MNCLHEAHLSEEKLIGFALDGEALPEDAQHHLEHCARCQQRIAHYQKSHDALVARFYRSQCPAGTDLSLYTMGLLRQKERQRIANHLVDCPLCSIEVEKTYSFIQSWPVPTSVLSPARSPLVRRIFAALVSQPQLQLSLRNDAREPPWPRHYQGEAVDLSLNFSHTSKGENVLIGVLTSAEADEDVAALTGIPAELYAAPWPGKTFSEQAGYLPLLCTQIDDMGNIVFKSVPVGEYFMVIHLPGREMIVEGLIIEND